MSGPLAIAWLDRRLLAVAIRGAEAPGGWRAETRDGERSTALSVRWLGCGGESTESEQVWLLTILTPEASGEPAPPLTLTDSENRQRRLDPGNAENPAALARQLRAILDPAARGRVQAFLAATPTSHRIPLTPELAAALHHTREILRDPLPETPIAPGPLTARLEAITTIDQHTFWLTGWIHEADPTRTTLTAITPEGARITPPPGATTHHPRPAYAKALDHEHTSTLGFHTLIQTPHPSRHPHGWTLELKATTGHIIQHSTPHPPNPDTSTLTPHILAQLRTTPQQPATLEHQILPTLTHLRFSSSQPQIEQVRDLGALAADPDVSLVIAARRPERIEHQLSQFVRDPELMLESVEVVYVTPPGPAGAPVAHLVEELHALYGFPLRLVVLSRPAPRARALNLGASQARGKLLVLMSGEVLPASPGWLSAMMRRLAGSGSIGAVAPKLLREDDSIANVGIRYVRRSADAPWQRTLPLAGLARSLPAARQARRIQAGSDACLLVEARSFHELGGFSELYLGDTDEAGDLGLRLAAAGRETWYEPEAELYLLDRPAVARKPSPVRDPFNAWLLEHRCGAALSGAAPAGTPPADPPAAERTGVALSGCARPGSAIVDSGRSGAPIAELEVVVAESAATVHGSLSLPAVAPERAPYENTYTFALTGAALASDGTALTVGLRAPGLPERRADQGLPSPELVERHPDLPGADTAGFSIVLSSLALPLSFELEVDAVAPDGARTRLGQVRGQRRPLRSGYRPELQPLLVTMLGRTGSTWLMALLSRHPQIVAYSPFIYEPMLASYWTAMLRTLAEPASYMQSVLPELYDDDWWTGHGRRSPLPLQKLTVEMARWLGRESVEAVAGFCQSRLDAFYKEAARSDGRPTPRYFAEKCVPGATPRLVAELYPEGREVVLVRDFRDRVCSIRDYNARQGHQLWGRDQAATEAEWFGYLRAEAEDLLANWTERRDRAHLMRYEDLVREPQQTLTALFAHLGVDAGAETIDSTLRRAGAMLPRAQANHQTSASVEASVGRWRQDLSDADKRACAAVFDDLLTEFGYEPTEGGGAAPGSSPAAGAEAADPATVSA